MKEITSTSNQIIKEVVKLQQKKYRDEFILVEGKKSVQEAIEANLEIKYAFSKEEMKIKCREFYLVNDAVMKKISTTESPATVVAVVKKPDYKIEAFKKMNKIVLLDSIKDSGNLGTIIRASSAFGVDGIFLYGDTTDEFSPKTIRSAAGNMFKIPVKKITDKELIEFKKTHTFLSTVVDGDEFLDNYRQKNNLIIMFGSEAEGLCKELLNMADEKVTIKMADNVESLNLAISAGIILYELQK